MFWKRQMDDVFFIWKGSKEELELFVWHLNGFEYRVQFTLEVEKEVFIAISGCWDHKFGRGVDNKDLQEADAHTAVYKLEL